MFISFFVRRRYATFVLWVTFEMIAVILTFIVERLLRLQVINLRHFVVANHWPEAILLWYGRREAFNLTSYHIDFNLVLPSVPLRAPRVSEFPIEDVGLDLGSWHLENRIAHELNLVPILLQLVSD